jgi:hypothetical protein
LNGFKGTVLQNHVYNLRKSHLGGKDISPLNLLVGKGWKGGGRKRKRERGYIPFIVNHEKTSTLCFKIEECICIWEEMK